MNSGEANLLVRLMVGSYGQTLLFSKALFLGLMRSHDGMEDRKKYVKRGRDVTSRNEVDAGRLATQMKDERRRKRSEERRGRRVLYPNLTAYGKIHELTSLLPLTDRTYCAPFLPAANGWQMGTWTNRADQRPQLRMTSHWAIHKIR